MNASVSSNKKKTVRPWYWWLGFALVPLIGILALVVVAYVTFRYPSPF